MHTPVVLTIPILIDRLIISIRVETRRKLNACARVCVTGRRNEPDRFERESETTYRLFTAAS